MVCAVAAVCACLACAVCAPNAARADEGAEGVSARTETATDQGPLIDTFIAGREQNQGLAVATTVGGVAASQRYYGFSDVAGTEEVDEGTAFEWGRCADLVVWTCVMQLVEAGLLDLDDPVAGLLPSWASLPEGYAGLDMLDLMNHTTGLDVAMNGARSSIPDGTTSVKAAFALFSVEAEFSPGVIVAYTPYDALLAAAVVEQVTQTDFATYAQENVFERLGMDGAYLMVGGSPSRFARQDGAPDQLARLAEGSVGPASTSSPRPSTGSVMSLVATVGDMLKLANGMLCAAGCPAAFDDPATSEELFSVTQAYPGLGAARIAHGLFAFPFASEVFGISATTTTGFSASVFVDCKSGLALAIATNQSGRADLTQGIARVLVGRSDAVVANASSPSNAMWVGTYQDAASPDHGPAKLLTAFERIEVSLNDQGVLTFGGLTATSLGAGVYSIDTAIDQDVYRFHVSLERGSEFSRISSDSYAVPRFTLFLEGFLLACAVAAGAVCFGYLCVCAWSWLRCRVLHRRRMKFQPAVMLLAAQTALAGGLGAFGVFQLSEGLPPAALSALLLIEGALVVSSALTAAWIVVTRWRRTQAWTKRQNGAAMAICLAALAMVLNLMYWELLP